MAKAKTYLKSYKESKKLKKTVRHLTKNFCAELNTIQHLQIRRLKESCIIQVYEQFNKTFCILTVHVEKVALKVFALAYKGSSVKEHQPADPDRGFHYYCKDGYANLVYMWDLREKKGTGDTKDAHFFSLNLTFFKSTGQPIQQ